MIGVKLFNWLFNSSPQNAAKPQVQQHTVPEIPNPAIEPIESYAETDSILGSGLKVGLIERASRENGQLVRTHDNVKAIIGCGHLIHQFQADDQEDKHVAGIAGQCFYCAGELEELREKGKVSDFDAERLSYVCTDCAQITESGKLCCPKHYKAVSNPDGTKAYLSSEDIKDQKRDDCVQLAKNSIAMLFGSNDQSKEEENE